MTRKFSLPRAALVSFCLMVPVGRAGLIPISNIRGPVTQAEIESFKAHMHDVEPEPGAIGNTWAQGHSGQMVKALGLMYEVSRDRAILDRMIQFADAVLSERNDIAPAPLGQHKDWLGHVSAVWANRDGDVIQGAAGEQGDPIGHLAYCAWLILSTPPIWNLPVPDGDPHHYGVTYLQRAKAYVTEGDYALDKFDFPYVLDMSHDNRYWWRRQLADGGGRPLNGPVPWNQQMMFNYGMQFLAADHEILKTRPELVAKYDGIVGASVKWFFSSVKRYQSPKTGRPCYDWGYVSPSYGEDSNHASLDVAGIMCAYASHRYGITAGDLAPLAHTVVDVMSLGPNHFAGRVDGTTGEKHAGATRYLRSGFVLLAAISAEDYEKLTQPDFRSGGTGDILAFARLMWVKDRVQAGAGQASQPASSQKQANQK